MKKAFHPVAYVDKDGKDKTRWMELGVAFDNEKGSTTILLDALPSPHQDSETGRFRYKIIVMEQEDKPQGRGAKK